MSLVKLFDPDQLEILRREYVALRDRIEHHPETCRRAAALFDQLTAAGIYVPKLTEIRMKGVAMEELRPPQTNGLTPRTNELPANRVVDWRTAALAEYTAAIAELAKVDELRAKVAQLRKGLIAFGIEVPDVPGATGQVQTPTAKQSARQPWTPADDARLLELKEQGLSGPEIAAVTGRALSAIHTRVSFLKKQAVTDAAPEEAA